MADSKSENKKPNPFASFGRRVGKFVKDCKGEIKKIVWPTVNSVFKNFGVVLVTIAIFSVFVFLLDTVFMQTLGLVMNISM